ncbi:MAG: hypothetical protein GY715_02425 [Planctomycetes bacterium]|nr:hypothetical protein [Planctomycetota bacterium]
MIRALLVIVVAAPLAACSLERPDPDKSFYALAAPTLESDGTARDVTVRVARARVAAPFGSRSLQYRTGPSRYEADYYENWADDPGALVAAAVGEALASNQTFRAVVDDTSVAADARVLELYVTALYADVTNRDQPRAVVGLRATLLDPGGRVVHSRRYKQIKPADGRDAASIVEAFNDALAAIVRNLAVELKGAT